jgi:pimeloyl-ACP methyl ester carboxylesterase
MVGPAHRAINPAAAKVASLLLPQFGVYTYDRRGRGESGDNATTPAVEREIEDLDALIAESGGSAFVFGSSSGALLALDAAAHGLSISKLALYEAPLIVDDSLPPLAGDYPERLHDLLAADRRGDAAELFSTDVMRLPAEAVAQMRSGPFWGELEKVAPALEYEAALYGDVLSGKPLSPERWGSVGAPTLVIDGGASLTMMHTGADALASVLPNARRQTLEGQTHDVAPEVLAPVLAEFFQSEG